MNSGERFVFASNHEFYDRADGLRPLERAYGFEFGRDQVVRLDTNMIYQVMHDLRNVEVGLVFATDGRVAAYDLLLLRDDRGFFPDYTMAPVIRQQTLQRHPELPTYLDQLSAVIDNETMAELNAMIDVDRKRITGVASNFLLRSGLRYGFGFPEPEASAFRVVRRRCLGGVRSRHGARSGHEGGILASPIRLSNLRNSSGRAKMVARRSVPLYELVGPGVASFRCRCRSLLLYRCYRREPTRGASLGSIDWRGVAANGCSSKLVLMVGHPRGRLAAALCLDFGFGGCDLIWGRPPDDTIVVKRSSAKRRPEGGSARQGSSRQARRRSVVRSGH